MNNTISNPKVEVPTGISLNDKDYMNSLLSTLKCMAKDYTVALTEASCEELFNKLKKDFDSIIDLQREVFEVMFKNGWYVLEDTEINKVNNKYNMLSKELNDILE